MGESRVSAGVGYMVSETEADRLRAVAEAQPAFARLMEIRITEASRDRVLAEMTARNELGNRNGVLHGGAILGFADNLGGTTASLNLPEGATTTTIESKTNFLRVIRIGDIAHAECVPLHRGRTTMVLQTTITTADGKVAAIVTQTQLVMRTE
jgi:uncharacterized protein (TIGR00369 family)